VSHEQLSFAFASGDAEVVLSQKLETAVSTWTI